MESLAHSVYNRAFIQAFVEHFKCALKENCNRCKNNLRCKSESHDLNSNEGYRNFHEFLVSQVKSLKQSDVDLAMLRVIKEINERNVDLLREATEKNIFQKLKSEFHYYDLKLYDQLEFLLTGNLRSEFGFDPEQDIF